MTAINFTIRKKDNGYQLIASYKIGRKWKQKSKQYQIGSKSLSRHND